MHPNDPTAPRTPTAPRPPSGRRAPVTAIGLGVAAALGGVVAPLAAAPTAQASTQTTPRATARTVPPAPGTHVVRPGDTLSALALRSGTTVAALARANGLRDPGHLPVGQRLTLRPAAPLPAAAPPSTPGPGATAVVRPGDTVTAIAARAGLPVTAVLGANGLGPRTTIHPGQVLALPGAATAARPAPAVRAAPTAPTAPTSTPPVASTFAGRTYAPTVTSAATTNRRALATRPAPGRDAVRRLVADTARAMGVDPALALAVAHQESGFDMRVVSPANAIGVMQVVPSSGAWASSLVGRHLDLLDARDNVVAGVAILRSLQATAADTATAIAGYYQGLAGVVRHGTYPDTRRYVANVQALMTRFG